MNKRIIFLIISVILLIIGIIMIHLNFGKLNLIGLTGYSLSVLSILVFLSTIIASIVLKIEEKRNERKNY